MSDKFWQSVRDFVVLVAILTAVLYVHDAEAQEDKRDTAFLVGVSGYVTGAFVGTGIGLVGALQPLYISGVHATNAAGAALYYYPPFAGLGTGFVGAVGSAAVASSAYVITDAIQEKGIKKYHKEVIAYYQDTFDETVDYYKKLFK